MKGYKATYNGKCQGLTYEVGKTYTFEGKLKMCVQGFHFCKNAKDTLNYYPFSKDFILFEVEASGKVETEFNKSVTDKLKVVRQVPMNEVRQLCGIKVKYDENGNMIYFKNSKGVEEWQEFDENGNLIHKKYSNGFESWREYDENGNEIHYKDSYGFESWQEFDENGNLIHKKYSNGFEFKITIE